MIGQRGHSADVAGATGRTRHRLRLCAVAAAGLLAAMGAGADGAGASSGPTVYTVANYPVQAQAKDAVTAKSQAVADGQQRAFKALIKRLVPVTAYKRLPNVPLARIQDMITGFSVRRESNSSTEYVASLDFEFDPRAVREVLRAEGLAFVEEVAPPTIVVPVYHEKAGAKSAALKAAAVTPAWRRVWSDIDVEHALTPVKIGNPAAGIHEDTIKGLIAGDEGQVRTLGAEYQSERVVLAHMEPSEDGKSLVVTLAGRDAVGWLSLTRSYRLYDGDAAYTAELAAVVSLGILEGRWKALRLSGPSTASIAPGAAPGGGWATSMDRGDGIVTSLPAAPSAASGDTVRMIVEFRGLGQWSAIRGRLTETSGIEDLEVGQMTARGAIVSLRYPGGASRLAQVLSSQGLDLTDQAGQLVLRAR